MDIANVESDLKSSIMSVTPFNMQLRRAAASLAIGRACVDGANLDALVQVLAATPAQSADDRGDDLCTVLVQGALTDIDVMCIEGRSESYIAPYRRMYGQYLDEPRRWTHSWTRVAAEKDYTTIALAAAKEVAS